MFKLKKDWFLPAITTTQGADWKAMIKEIDALQIKQLAVFATCLKEAERKEMYSLLEKTRLKGVPFVHLRSDMKAEELKYFIKKWQTKVFNIHPQAEYPLKYDYSEYRKMIYIENVYAVFDEKELKQFAGISLDLSHLENDRHFFKERYDSAFSMLKRYRVGCNHISAVKEAPAKNWPAAAEERYDRHNFADLSEFDYVFRYPRECFSEYIALELENSLSEQLRVIEYLCGR